MKKYTLALFQFLAFSCILIIFASCEKDEGKLPSIEFKTGVTYTSADKTLAKGETILVGIKASKTEDKDVLKTFNVSVSYDGAAANTTVNQALTGSQGDNYEVDVPITARNQDGTEKYTFTVVNRDGLVNSVTLTLTIQ